MAMFHEDLKSKIDEYIHLIYSITKSFPKDELYGATSQIRRAALSVMLNYIEGFARGRDKVQLNFLEISYGSLQESKYLLDFSLKEKYISETDFKQATILAEGIGAMLWGIMRNLRGDKGFKKPQDQRLKLQEKDTRYKIRDTRGGFTALEMLLVVAFIIILLGIVTISFRDQPAKNRNSERRNEVNAIADALAQWSFNNNTPFGVIAPPLPSSAECIGTQTTPTTCYDLTSFLVPQYLNSIPEDPKNTNGQADTGYTIYRDTFVDVDLMTKTKEIIIGAPNTENGDPIQAVRK